MSEEEKTVPRASVEKTSKKRKRDAQVTNDLESSKRAQKSTHRNETSGDEVNPLIAQMDPSLLSDHIAQKTKRFRPDISLVEADDLHISSEISCMVRRSNADKSATEDRILDTTSYQPIRTADNLSSFVEQFSKSSTSGKKVKLSVAPNAKGSPHTIIVAAAGLRAADLTRAVRQFQTKDSMVAKLFAKHIKLKEASDMVKKSRIGIGVGTPQRIIDLLENGM